MEPSCDGFTFSDAPMNLYAAPRTPDASAAAVRYGARNTWRARATTQELSQDCDNTARLLVAILAVKGLAVSAFLYWCAAEVHCLQLLSDIGAVCSSLC